MDIQQIAVEIAKLRFFISLLVDEGIDKTKENWGIEPLPNLDFKIMQGNSLISKFLGVDFDNGQEKQEAQTQVGLGFENEDDSLIKEFERKKIDYQNESDKDKKAKFKAEVEDLMINLFEAKLQKKYSELKPIEEKAQSIPNLKMREEYIRIEKEKFSKKHGFDLENIEKQLREFISKKKKRPFFSWKLYFAEVFQDKGGFDIVIANPPYVGEKGHKEVFRKIKQSCLVEFYQRKMDLFYFFFHLALNLGKQDSNIAFITTNYYPTATAGKKLRDDFRNRATISRLINFNELKIFKSALGQHNMITILQKRNNENAPAKICITKRRGNANSEILQVIIEGTDTQTDYFQPVQKDLYDGDECYIRFAGSDEVTNNPVQAILEKLKSQSKRLDSLCEVNQGILTGADKIKPSHLKRFPRDGFQQGDGVYVLSEEEKVRLDPVHPIFKPWFKNSDIHRYFTETVPQEFVFYATRDIKLNKSSSLYHHFLKFEKIIKARNQDRGEMQAAQKLGKWWAIFAARRDVGFEGPKIVAPQRSKTNTFGYNEIPWYASADVYFITQKDKSVLLKYILALLNSRLYFLWLYHRGKRKGEILELYQTPLSEIPIKKIPEPNQKPFIEIVDKILEITKSSDYMENPDKQAQVKEYEKQIDQMVYKLYGLTPEEIEIVENSAIRK